MEVFFIAGFFMMLLLAGVSVISVLAALLVAAVIMLLSGIFFMAFKLLPWLLLAVAVAWIYQHFFTVRPAKTGRERYDKILSKINRMNRRG